METDRLARRLRSAAISLMQSEGWASSLLFSLSLSSSSHTPVFSSIYLLWYLQYLSYL